jgi:hypothetical protein
MCGTTVVQSQGPVRAQARAAMESYCLLDMADRSPLMVKVMVVMTCVDVTFGASCRPRGHAAFLRCGWGIEMSCPGPHHVWYGTLGQRTVVAQRTADSR